MNASRLNLEGLGPEATAHGAGVELPVSRRREGAIACAAALLAAGYLLVYLHYDVLHADEGIGLEAAERILRGQVMYRDFFSFFTPGSGYWLALLFRVFGDSMTTAHAALVGYGAAFSGLVYLIARRAASRRMALLAAGLVALDSLPFRFLMLHNWDSTLLALAGYYAVLRWWQRPRQAFALAAGALTALTFLFNQAKGAGLAAGLLLGWALLARIEGRTRWNRRQAAAFTLGLLGPLALTAGYFAAQHCLGLMLRDWFWPLAHYRTPNACPYGYFPPGPGRVSILSAGSGPARLLIAWLLSPLLVVDLLPWLAAGIVAFLFCGCRAAAPSGARRAYFALIASLMTGSLFGLLATNRPGGAELLMAFPLYAPALAWLLDRPSASRLRRIAPAAAVLVGLSFSCLGLAWLWPRRAARIGLVTRRGRLVLPQTDRVLPYLTAHTRPGNRIYVYPYQPVYYYLSATRNPTRYEFLALGQNTRRQYLRAVAELKRHPPRLVLYDPGFYAQNGADWPSIALPAFARITPVEQYLLRQFQPCRRLCSATGWNYLLLAPRRQACPR